MVKELNFIQTGQFKQETVACGLDYEISKLDDPKECYLKSLAIELEPKRDALGKVLAELGMTPTIPEGGYFMMADISKLSKFCTLLNK